MKKRRKKGTGTISIGIIVLAFLAVLSVQMLKLGQKVEAQNERIGELNDQLAEEIDRAEDILLLEETMKDTKFIEEQAKSKLGLVYDNEIIFKEKED